MKNVRINQRSSIRKNVQLMVIARALQLPLTIEITPESECDIFEVTNTFKTPLSNNLSVDYEVEDDYRGCSPFTAADEQIFECGSASVNGFDHVNCKATCGSSNCNKEDSEALGDNRLQERQNLNI